MPQTNYLTNTKSTARRSGNREKRRNIEKHGNSLKSTKTDEDVGDHYEALTMGVTPKTFMMTMTKMAIMLMMTIDDDDPYGNYDECYDG